MYRTFDEVCDVVVCDAWGTFVRAMECVQQSGRYFVWVVVVHCFGRHALGLLVKCLSCYREVDRHDVVASPHLVPCHAA